MPSAHVGPSMNSVSTEVLSDWPGNVGERWDLDDVAADDDVTRVVPAVEVDELVRRDPVPAGDSRHGVAVADPVLLRRLCRAAGGRRLAGHRRRRERDDGLRDVVRGTDPRHGGRADIGVATGARRHAGNQDDREADRRATKSSSCCPNHPRQAIDASPSAGVGPRSALGGVGAISPPHGTRISGPAIEAAVSRRVGVRLVSWST